MQTFVLTKKCAMKIERKKLSYKMTGNLCKIIREMNVKNYH